MLRSGKAKPIEAWHKVSATAGPPANPAITRTRAADSEDSDSEDRVPIPVFQSSFGDAIQAALDSYDTHKGRSFHVNDGEV